VIGRGGDAGITIADAGSSRRHAEILWDGERAMLRDLGSTNGTKIDGQKVREAALSPDTAFTIGRTELVFRVVPGPSTGSGTQMRGAGSGTQRGAGSGTQRGAGSRTQRASGSGTHSRREA